MGWKVIAIFILNLKLMDFLLYLTPVANNILDHIISSGTNKVQENAPICKKYYEVFGYFDSQKLIMCTDNIKNTISPVDYYVNETLYHESVHLAQSCRGGALGVKNPSLSKEKMEEVVRSSSYNNATFKYELEAYYLETRPEEVLTYIKKYCF